MKKKNRKFPLPLWERVRVRGGISAVPLIFALVLLISLGAFFISLMLGKHIGAPLLAQSTKALYIADAGIEFTKQYLRDRIGFPWTDITNVPDIPSTNFGEGTFAVAFSTRTQNSVTATSTGTIGNAVRVISINFERKSLLSLSPGNWVSEIKIDDNVTVEMDDDGNGTAESFSCPECDAEAEENEICSCTGCTNCINSVTLEQAPPPIPPTGFTWWDGANPPITNISGYNPNDGRLQITGSSNFSEGIYFFDKLEIDSGAIVTITGTDRVTIWIQDKFEMKDASQFNLGGDAANLLLLSAGGPEDAEPDFEIEGGAMFSGAIYGPNPEAEVEIRDAQIVGAIVGNEVELRDTIITHDPNAGLNAPGFPQALIIVKGSDWGEM